MTAIRIGADIGGTFTDVVIETPERRHSTKVLTDYTAPEAAIIRGIEAVLAEAGITAPTIETVIHGTTLATNALIERRGAKTALLTTEGFRDVIEMRTESRFEQYDLNLALPEPLLPRQCRFTVPERLDRDGKVLIPLDESALDAVATRMAKAGFTSIAVGFLHSYANPAHERRARDILARHLPHAMISISSEVSPQMREYERFNTTIANAYVQPQMDSYLGRLESGLAAIGCTAPVYLVHSGGGIVDLDTARRFPVRLVESGPAGGAVFAADLARAHGVERVLSFDMGGTTAKICLIRKGRPQTARVFEVARSYRFKKGSGMPISIPVIDMVEIGAGGGSLAHIDALDRIAVGPESAGSEPGPAAYGRGGEKPAVTDADLVLGRLDPQNFAGGKMALDVNAARQALETHLEMDADTAALGVSEMVDETMSNAARVHAVENGEDLSDYTMIAFGGAAPLHAARLCQKLGIARLLVPQGAGVGSAIGFLKAPYAYESTRTRLIPLENFDAPAARALIEETRAEAAAFVEASAPGAPVTTDIRLFMRYRGQGWEIPVPLDAATAANPDAATLTDLFETAYAQLFGRTVAGGRIEIASWSAAVSTIPPAPGEVPETTPSDARAPATRPLFDPATETRVEAALLARADLAPGATHPGPALVTEDETTTVVPPAARLSVLGDGTLAIDFGDRT